MGSEYEGPDFSYAYGGESPLKETNEQPAPTSAVQASENTEDAPQMIGTGSDQEESMIDSTTGATKLVSHEKHDSNAPENERTSDDGFFDREDTPNPVPPPVQDTIAREEQVDSTSEAKVEGVEEQDLNQDSTDLPSVPNGQLEANAVQHEAIEQSGHETETIAQNGQHPEENAVEEHPPSENYEHQGETTLLEEATQEASTAPLVKDTEPQATPVDWGTADADFDFGNGNASNTAPAAAAETLPESSQDATISTGKSKAPGIEWDVSGDVDFDLGGPKAATEHATEAPKAASNPEDLDALWQAALDDDEFLGDDAVDTGAFVFDDDEGFLEEAATQPPQDESAFLANGAASNSMDKYAPTAAQEQNLANNQYIPQGPQFTDFSQLNRQQAAAAIPAVPYGAYGQPSSYQQQPTRPSAPSSAQSFADKSKGGYSSPYDLPEDIAKPRRRPAPMQHVSAPVTQTTAPPPRSSSMYGSFAVSPRPPPASNMSAASLSPPSSSQSMQSPMTGLPGAGTKQPTPKSSNSEFFADLPVVAKPRHHAPRPYSPQTIAPAPPASQLPPPPQRTGTWPAQPQEAQAYVPPATAQLQPPEKLPPFPDLATSPARSNSLPVPSRYSPAPPSAPAASSRYSPAPPTAPATGPRYSPAPPPQAPGTSSHNRYASEPVGPQRPAVQPFAPRTSSPLAYHANQEGTQSRSSYGQYAPHEVSHHAMHSADGIARLPLRRPLEEVSELEEQQDRGAPGGAPPSHVPETMEKSPTPPPPRSGPPSTLTSPRRRSNYVPNAQPSAPTSESAFVPPQRSQTQSPSAAMKRPAMSVTSIDRPASAHSPAAPVSGLGVGNAFLPHRRGFSRDFDFVAPSDERASDPLERWKGCPVFTWGLGGTVISSFPKHVPRYAAGQTQPMMKCGPGEMKVQNIKEIYPLSGEITKFPGPLKAKGKKKDVLTWLGSKIDAFEKQLQTPDFNNPMTPETSKRLEEKILLWKVVRLLVENDGHVEGTPTIVQAVETILSLPSEDSSAPSYGTGAELLAKENPTSSQIQPEPINPQAVAELRGLLAKGEREKAVWQAVDQRLWAHAMLLSSTLSRDIWKQVVQEFVRQEVKNIGGGNQSLAALYTIFAGNWAESVDELVPASARAGFQMVSKNDGIGATKNTLEGLDKWRETLLLVLNNRTDGDVQALIALGKLLAGYGRVEAAHICYIFARSVARLSGVDDPQADIVLLGADHVNAPYGIGKILEAVLLTEVYEFAVSLSSSTPSHVPHLQSYKLAHAYSLAEYGYRTEAQQYCDAIFAGMKSTTKASPYFNTQFISALDDLTKRLSQSPKDGSSSWISKPSMDKVSGTLWTKFNNFVAGGDDSDAASTHSANGNDVGPFAKIAGSTPTISPSPSSADLYGSYPAAAYGVPAQTATGSRYAPAASTAPRGSLDQPRGRYDPHAHSPYPSSRPSLESNEGSYGGRRASETASRDAPQLGSPYTPSSYSPPAHRTQAPRPNIYSPPGHEAPAFPVSYSSSPYQPTPPSEEAAPTSFQAPSSSYEPPSLLVRDEPSGDEPTSNGYAPLTSTYEPYSSSYEPPAYVPYQPDDEPASPVEEVKRKKSFMDDEDDDEDLARRAAELKKQQKAEADRIAEENFRKAAEADAAKGKDALSKKGSSSWLGGWFKKDPNTAPGPIKAKLGEESSFVYDPELKRWVNKKDPNSTPVPIATPPPPKGPSPRSASGSSLPPLTGSLSSSVPGAGALMPPPSNSSQRSSSMPPPMGPPRSATPMRSDSPAPSDGGAPPMLMRPPPMAGPPSRPNTSMSNASSIDDLLGAPAARKGGTVKKGKKGGRYVDVMAQK